MVTVCSLNFSAAGKRFSPLFFFLFTGARIAFPAVGALFFFYSLSVKADVIPPNECVEFRPLFEALVTRPGSVVNPQRESQSRQIEFFVAAIGNEWAQYQLRYHQGLIQTSRQIFKSYLAGTFQVDSIEKCLKDSDDRDNLETVLPSVFFDETIATLRVSSSPLVRSFVARMDANGINSRTVIFRVVGYLNQQAPTSSLGSFHRGSSAISMNFSRIDPKEWFVIFIHEMLHAMDPIIGEAKALYEDRSLQSVVASVASTPLDRPLAPDAIAKTKIWLRAGLDLNLLAEYRAWTLTLMIYEEGRSAGEFARLPWLESVLALKKPEQDYRRFTYSYLDSSFQVEAKGMYLYLSILNLLSQVRSELALSQEPPPLGEIGKILDSLH